jgi:hypothetical protein
VIAVAPPKDPAATLDYSGNWAGLLVAGETIVSSTWAVDGSDAALSIGTGDYAPTFDGTSATVWLSGGTEDVTYTITNHVVTSNTPPRIDERSFSITIAPR